MRIVLQKVTRAEVRVDDERISRIGLGLAALVAVEKGDDASTVAAAADKLANVRCFPDADGRMNLSIGAADGEFLLVSQFTLAARLDRGRRPSFERAAPPDEAAALLEGLAASLEERGLRVRLGRFGAHMEVELVNDGPVTLILEL